jgi:hypothetical protein
VPVKWKVEVTGLRQVFDALDEWDKKAGDKLKKRITTGAKQIATEASYISPYTNPLSGWGNWRFSRDGRDLGFDPMTVARSYRVRRNNYRRKNVSAGIAWEVYSANPGGNIFEVIGSGDRVGEESNFNWQGQGFVDRINQRFKGNKKGQRPRTLVPAYYKVVTPELREEIRQSIIRAAREAGLV